MTRPDVSVVIAVRNGERFLPQTIESVLAQTMTQFELVVVDDGSSDRTTQIIRHYASDPRVRLIQLEPCGIAQALNAGLASARADLIARIDADDIMLPERLQRQCAFMAEHPEIGAAASNYWIIDEQGETRGFNDSPIVDTDALKAYLDRGGRFVFPAPTMILRRAVVMALNSYNPDYTNSEDVDLCMRIITSGHPIIYQPERLTKFRVHDNSQSAHNTRIQYYFMDLIHTNYERFLNGEMPLTRASYEADLAALSWHRQLYHELRVQSALALRRHHVAQVRGSRLASVIHLGVAAALDTPRTYRKILRSLNQLRSRKGVRTSQLDGPETPPQNPVTSAGNCPPIPSERRQDDLNTLAFRGLCAARIDHPPHFSAGKPGRRVLRAASGAVGSTAA